MPLVSIPESEEIGFKALLSELGLDRSQFALTLTKHPVATFGPEVSTIKIYWKNMLEAEYGATDSTSWIELFRADWDSGLIPGIVAEKLAEQSDSSHPAT